VSTLAKKRRRDMARQKWQFIAVLVTVVLGVGMFAGSFNAYLNLDDSLQETYERLAMADLTVTGADARFVETAAATDGVETAIERQQADVPFVIGEDSFIGRVVGMPADEQPAINRIDVDEGVYLDPTDPSKIVLQSHASADFGLEVGETFTIAGQDVTVVGVAASPEYLWPARDSQNMFTPPKSFAVAFVHEDILLAADAPAIRDQVLVLYDDGADTEQVDAALRGAANPAGATQVETLEEQPSNFTITTEIDGLQTMAVALPILFLAAAAMAVYVVVTRMVFSQRGVIGTLRASGFSRTQMSRHYLGFGLIVGIVGSLIGMVFGSLMGRGMTALYTNVFGIPDLVAEVHLPTIVIALGFGASTGVIAGIAPARAVARLAPAEAMRGEAPPEAGKASIFEKLVPPLRNAPVRWKMSLRGIGRNKKRSGSMVAGVVLGLILILSTWGMLDTMLGAMDRQFDDIALEDVNVVVSEPVQDRQVNVIAEVEGVAIAEPVIGLRATLVNGDEEFVTSLEGYATDTEVHGFDPPLPDAGLLVGQAMKDELGISEGDTVTVEITDLGVSFDTEIMGFVDEPMGTAAYISSDSLVRKVAESGGDEAATALIQPSISTIKAIYEDGTDNSTVLSAIKDVEIVVVAVDSNELQDLVEDFQVFFYLFVGIMLIFGGALAFALIFNIISVNVAEREGEFASMRANGLTHRRVAQLIMGETMILTVIGIVPGLLVGYMAANALMTSYSSPEFPITANIRPISFVGAAIVMIVVALLSLVPAVRAVKRIDVGEVVRERSA